ncbi:ZZ-type zinc finger-containing protein P35G2.11c [Grifola frondosa]|uniref:ZZ-type zinc finger-containing protein P35G2.11c n=1 Tax=Grifola frondosa TaxID=5627 RepID=A0A1C7MAJ5_GRIFR|nr:ZZ-type zinc finger-containing protein P35G2.11c [Grifola frondosa]
MSYSDYGGSSYEVERPDKALVVKVTHDGSTKRITFASSRNCSYDVLRQKVEQAFSLSPNGYTIGYKDDEGETNDITTEAELTDAINFFKPTANDDPPVSSAASILSVRSLRQSKITLRILVIVDYDGPSLSDTGSLISLEEYKDRNGSDLSLSMSSPFQGEVDDDSITVSSKDMGSKFDLFRRGGQRPIVCGPSREPLISKSPESLADESEVRTFSSISQTIDSRANGMEDDPFSDARFLDKYPEDPSSVLEHPRGAAWLREQKARNMKSILGGSPTPSSSSQISYDPPDDEGSLALHQDRRGKYYYSFTVGSGSSGPSRGTPDSGYDDGASAIIYHGSIADSLQSRPASTDELQVGFDPHRISNPFATKADSESTFSVDYSDIPPEVPFIQPRPPQNPPHCSKCGTVLEFIRYVCSTCGETDRPSVAELKLPDEWKGKSKAINLDGDNTYPPISHRFASPSPSASSSTIVPSSDTPSHSFSDGIKKRRKLPSIPSSPSCLLTVSIPGSNGVRSKGYELCSGCLEESGVEHALMMSLSPGSSPRPGSSPEDTQRALARLTRTAPSQKGQLRHAFIEKSWTHVGWIDVEQDDQSSCTCSTCNIVITNHRFKCVSCPSFDLCRACYSQVHEIHPRHAFLLVPDKFTRSRSGSSGEIPPLPVPGEPSMMHPGVLCAHCLQAIVGARFHCVICDSVDICHNCDSAGLPGNFDVSDGGHTSSHVMIKIPYPMSSTELQVITQKAKTRWSASDSENVQRMSLRSRRNSLVSSYSQSQTILGSGSRGPASTVDSVTVLDDSSAHGMRCDGCAQPIIGERYQCANCPSAPKAFSLCSRCEDRSYALHDPMHVFFKLPRPVDRPLQSDHAMLPRLYKCPVGPSSGLFYVAAPTEYLRSLLHNNAVCDRCFERIKGKWFRCAYCPKDLCEACEGMDTHDDTHVFMVFKSSVDMQAFRRFANVENPHLNPPVIPYPIYRP